MTLEQLKEAISKLKDDDLLRLLRCVLDLAEHRKGDSSAQLRVGESRGKYSQTEQMRGSETMTTVQITLPDQLARQAEHAGLLSPERIEQWLRAQLKEQRIVEFFTAMDRMTRVDDPKVMSPEEVARELASMRAENRSTRKS